METKRLSFPRFFFVSTTDLLDILSNGNVPNKISEFDAKINYFDIM
jgi:dynein heavy chain